LRCTAAEELPLDFPFAVEVDVSAAAVTEDVAEVVVACVTASKPFGVDSELDEEDPRVAALELVWMVVDAVIEDIAIAELVVIGAPVLVAEIVAGGEGEEEGEEIDELLVDGGVVED
jgi:hypothetical protein